MTRKIKAQLSPEGALIIPQELYESLGLAAGDYVVLHPVPGGILLTTESPSRMHAADLLRYLVVSLGKQAEQQGIVEEDDLDAVIDQVQQQVYRERYGG